MVHVNLIISGKVQGVGYRATAAHMAKKLNLKGWVKNMPDGTVNLAVEGPEEIIQQLIAWCQQGPYLAQVDQVTCIRGKLEGYQSFKVKH